MTLREQMLLDQCEADQRLESERLALLHLGALLEQWMDGDVAVDDVLDDLDSYLIFRPGSRHIPYSVLQ